MASHQQNKRQNLTSSVKQNQQEYQEQQTLSTVPSRLEVHNDNILNYNDDDNALKNNNVVINYGGGGGTGGGDLVSFPPGYRFCPTDVELIEYYLKKKVFNLPLPPNNIMDVDLYKFNPNQLAEQYEEMGNKQWYFFTPRERKYLNGSRPNRAAGDGYWKATGADKPIKVNRNVVGVKKALVFYTGKAPYGEKTDWIMHEFRVPNAPLRNKISPNDMRLDECVLCRIYEKEKPKKVQQEENENEEEEEEEENIQNEVDENIPAVLSEKSAPQPQVVINDNAVEEMSMYYEYIQSPYPSEFSDISTFSDATPLSYCHEQQLISPNFPPLSNNNFQYQPNMIDFAQPIGYAPPPDLVHSSDFGPNYLQGFDSNPTVLIQDDSCFANLGNLDHSPMPMPYHDLSIPYMEPVNFVTNLFTNPPTNPSMPPSQS